jgi:hypothetical protein
LAAGDQLRPLEELRSSGAVTTALCQHVLEPKRDASFRWHDGVGGESIMIDRSPV